MRCWGSEPRLSSPPLPRHHPFPGLCPTRPCLLRSPRRGSRGALTPKERKAPFLPRLFPATVARRPPVPPARSSPSWELAGGAVVEAASPPSRQPHLGEEAPSDWGRRENDGTRDPGGPRRPFCSGCGAAGSSPCGPAQPLTPGETPERPRLSDRSGSLVAYFESPQRMKPSGEAVRKELEQPNGGYSPHSPPFPAVAGQARPLGRWSGGWEGPMEGKQLPVAFQARITCPTPPLPRALPEPGIRAFAGAGGENSALPPPSPPLPAAPPPVASSSPGSSEPQRPPPPRGLLPLSDTNLEGRGAGRPRPPSPQPGWEGSHPGSHPMDLLHSGLLCLANPEEGREKAEGGRE